MLIYLYMLDALTLFKARDLLAYIAICTTSPLQVDSLKKLTNKEFQIKKSRSHALSVPRRPCRLTLYWY